MDVDQGLLREEIENELIAWLVQKDARPKKEEGWITASMLSTKTGVSYDRANSLLNNGVEAGELELWVYGKTNYYRMKKPVLVQTGG